MTKHRFKPLELDHIDVFQQYFREDPPQTSELTFTNLFMWRHHYRPRWLERGDCLFIMLRIGNETPFGLPPVGSCDKEKALGFFSTNCEKATKSRESAG